MKALVAAEYGPPWRVLSVTDVERPRPEPGQVLVRVEAAALNTLDLHLITGPALGTVTVDHPCQVGTDLAGAVVTVGEEVTGYAPGDAVVAFSPDGGAIAEYAVVDGGPHLAHRPAGLDAVPAATIPESGLTALNLLRAAAPHRGDTMLVIGATGGIGMYAIQFAVAEGAEIIATATPDTGDYVRSLGAAHIIDYTSIDVAEGTLDIYPDGVDVSMDLVNLGAGIAGNAALVRSGGRVVSPLRGPSDLGCGVTAHYIGRTRPNPGDLDGLATRAARGDLRIVIGATYPLLEAVRAVEDFDTKSVCGKVVITV